MAEEDLAQYKDISELRKELEGMKGRKEIPAKDLYEAVQKLTQTVTGMLDIFSAATEQMRLEEREFESESRKHEMIISKLDKLIDQNKTIAEAMVGIVDMVKEKIVPSQREKDESFFKQPEPSIAEPSFMKPHQEWEKPEDISPPMQFTPSMPPQFTPQMPQASQQQPSPFSIQPPPMMTPQMPGFEMPPMEPAPPPDFDFPEEPFPPEEPKKKGLFRMFKK